MKGRINNKLGEIQINPEVIAKYAGITAVECFGIVGMAAVSMKDGLVKLLKKERDVYKRQGKVSDENAYVGRTYMDAPGVDGLIFINTDLDLMSGDFVRAKVTGALEYDLIGEICDEPAQ